MASRKAPLRVLLLADDCNPEWPSLPVVGFKYARALAELCDVTVATQVRNRSNIEKADRGRARFRFIDTEYVARPLSKLSAFLRGGVEVAWSTNMMMNFLPYIEFERQCLRAFREPLAAGAFDLVHRITPMSPALPSFAAGRTGTPFILGPLNGNLPWPPQFREEMVREKERLRALRGLYRYLPFSRATYARADAILAAFRHTIEDLDPAHADRIVPFPEVGYDEAVFHPPPGRGEGNSLRFLFVGRLVPYKLPEVAIRAFAQAPDLDRATLHLVGEGPERPRLEALIAGLGLGDRVRLEGRADQAGVAEWMRRCDVFLFPSIRELGAGVVVEAMASGMTCIGVAYGAPGDLLAQGRGLLVPLADRETLVGAFAEAMTRCARQPERTRETARRGRRFSQASLAWEKKAEITREVYEWVLKGREGSKPDFFGRGPGREPLAAPASPGSEMQARRAG